MRTPEEWAQWLAANAYALALDDEADRARLGALLADATSAERVQAFLRGWDSARKAYDETQEQPK